MPTIIEACNISKKYILNHGDNANYDTMVETLTNKARACLRKLRGSSSTHPKKQQEEFWALQNISLRIEEGDRLGIIGKNGAGKSTLLKILSRITEPTSGSIKIRGRISSLLEVGTGFHPELTGRENIFLNGAILGMSQREIAKKFDEIVAFAEIDAFLNTPVKRYSSGMFTRLGFAVAAHLDPDIFIIDEVLAVGDSQFQKKCLQKLSDLNSHGRTVIFVSHDIGSILALCNKGLFLEKGRVKEYGPIDQCVNAYMNGNHAIATQWIGCEGDEHLHVTRAELKIFGEGENNKQNTPREFFYQHEKVLLEIDYEVFIPSIDLRIGLEVWTKHHKQIASSSSADNVDNYHQFTQKGQHRATFILDVGLFHEGEYVIKIESAVHNKKQILSDDVLLKFEVYAAQKNTRFRLGAPPSGIFLGNHWKLNE
jgi:lipopolysaccharide transport system ATP-binding protein